MSVVQAEAALRPRRGKLGPIVDCDVHQTFASIDELFPYLSKRWIEYIRETNFTWRFGLLYPRAVGAGMRVDARPDDGRPAGSDLSLMKSQLLDEFDIDFALLNAGFHETVSLLPNPDFAAALCTAYNDWVINDWLGRDPRLKASILVPVQDPRQAVKEIERVGGHPDIVQVLLPSGSRTPYGQRHYWPVWEAAAAHGLVVGLHAAGQGSSNGNPPTPVGWVSYYLELHSNFALAYMANLSSFICEGVFEKVPNFKLTLIEGGFTWLPHLLWKLDKNYKSLRSEVPWLKRLPSEYIPDHVRLTTQPWEDPKNESHLVQVIDMIDGANILMFASDYPHWDFDSPRHLPKLIPDETKKRILGENAIEWYGLGRNG